MIEKLLKEIDTLRQRIKLASGDNLKILKKRYDELMSQYNKLLLISEIDSCLEKLKIAL